MFEKRTILIIAAQNLASNNIVGELLAALKDEPVELVLFPNTPASNGREVKRIFTLIGKSSVKFILFKFAEIYVASALQYLKGRTIAQSCRQGKIPCHRLSSPNGQEFFELVESIRPRVILSAGPNILPGRLFRIAGCDVLNCHCARLPEYRGAANYLWMLLNGEEYGYVSIQKMEPKLDEGPLLAETAMDISGFDSAYRLNHEFSRFAGRCYARYVRKFLKTGRHDRVETTGREPANRGLPKADDIRRLEAAGKRLFRWSEFLKLT